MGNIEDAIATTSVSILADRFRPGAIEVTAGETVSWSNDDATPHTVSSAEIESGEIAAGGCYRYTFDRPGHYRYFCMIHPRTVGEVFVR
jgi:plastocyanin